MFEHIIGNERIKEYLTRMVEKGAIGNSLLFSGPDGVGKSLFAKSFAKLLIPDPRVDTDRHPDVHHYYPEGKIGMHTIDSMRRFSEEVYLAPLESKWKIFIIHEADRMLSYSANALLKTFEEPADDAVIILISGRPTRLLPTVLSRCRTVHFCQIPFDMILGYIRKTWEVEESKALEIASRSQGSIGRTHRLMQEETEARDLILRILSQGSMNYGELIDHIQLVAGQLEEAQDELSNAIRQELLGGYCSELNATQKQALEKEVEGAVAMRLAEEAQGIFDVILGWYRDLELIKCSADSGLLIHHDQKKRLEQAFQCGELLPLEKVHQVLSDAKLAQERSTPLAFILENLFLRLKTQIA